MAAVQFFICMRSAVVAFEAVRSRTVVFCKMYLCVLIRRTAGTVFFNDILIDFMYLSMAVAVCIPLRPEAAVPMYGNRTADGTVTSLLLGMLMKQFPEAASSVLLTAIMSMDYGRGYTAISFFRRYFKSAQARRYQCQT